VVFESREGDDGVKILEAKTKTCSARSFVSCQGEGGKLELTSTTVRRRAWRNTACMKRFERRRPYQEVQDFEVGSVARSLSPG
jgi:hypothetical protein